MYNENLTVADLNGDGFKEIIAPTDTHYITALDRNGNQLLTHPMYDHLGNPGPTPWARVGVHVDHAVDLVGFANCGTQHRPNFANSAPAIADLDGDGTREIVVPGDVYNCGDGEPAGDLYHLPWILRLDRSRWAGSGFDWTVAAHGRAGQRPGLAELRRHREQRAERGAGGPRQRRAPGDPAALLRRQAARVVARQDRADSWPFDVPGTGIRFASEPAVADLDNDGQAEVIFTSWGEKAGNTRGQLHIVSSQGVQLHAVDLPAPSGGLERRPGRALAREHRRRSRPRGGRRHLAHRRARLRSARHRERAHPVGHGPREPASGRARSPRRSSRSPTQRRRGQQRHHGLPSPWPVPPHRPGGHGRVRDRGDGGTRGLHAASGVVTFPPGPVAQNVTVPVVGDIVDEPDETFVLGERPLRRDRRGRPGSRDHRQRRPARPVGHRLSGGRGRLRHRRATSR